MELVQFITTAGVALFILVLIILTLSHLLLCRWVCAWDGITIQRIDDGVDEDEFLKIHKEVEVDSDLFSRPRNMKYVNDYCCICVTTARSMKYSDSIYLPNARRIEFGQNTRSKRSERFIDFITNFPLLPKNEICPICLEMFIRGKEAILLRCSHCFHEGCIYTWTKYTCHSNSSCPVCKDKLHPDDLIITEHTYPSSTTPLIHTRPTRYDSILPM